MNGSYQLNSFAAGFKANPTKHLLLTGNITVKVGNGGLRAKVVPLLGISYSFSDLGFGFLKRCDCPKR